MPTIGTDPERRRFLKLAGSATVATALAGCSSGDGGSGDGGSGEGSSGGSDSGSSGSSGGSDGDSSGSLVTYSRGSKSTTLDQQTSTNGENTKVIKQIYDTMVMLDPGTYTIAEALATEWTFEGKKLTFTLREGVTFHNGEEFTADDLIATYRRHIDPSYEHYPGKDYVSDAGTQELGAYVEDQGWEKKGEYEVSFTLKQQYAPFLRNWVSYEEVVYSENAIAELGKDLSSQPVGTGPFELDNWDTGNKRIRLTANDDYWGDGPYVDEVLFTVIPENSSRAQAVVSGDADIVDGLDPQSITVIENSEKAKIRSKQGLNTGFIGLNMSRFEPFRNRKVRQAMNYAIDMKSITQTIFKGVADQSSQAIPPNLWGHNDDIEPYPYDPEKARQLLEEAGYGDGFELQLETTTNPRPYMPAPVQAAEVAQSNLEDVGISTTINKQPFGAYVTYILKGKHQACFLGHFGVTPDPYFFAYTLLHPHVDESQVPDGQDWIPWDTEGYNKYGMCAWANRDYMKLVEDAQQVYDQNQRASKYEQAMSIAHEEAPWVFMDHAKYIRGVNNRVKNWVPDGNITGPYLWLVKV